MELLRMAQRERQQRRPAPRAYAALRATETPKMDGVKLNSNGSVTIHGTTYGRDQFRTKLEEIVKTMQGDPASAYRDRKNPNHLQTVEEISLAYKFLNNELSPQDETAIVSEWQAATQESEVSTTLLPHQELAQIVSSSAGKIALQRARTGQPLDAAQKKIVERRNELEASNNTIARKEQAGSGGWMSTRRPPSIPSELFDLERIQDPRERTFAIRELRSRWRDDKASPFNDVQHPEHRNHVQAMQRLYQEKESLGRQPEDPECGFIDATDDRIKQPLAAAEGRTEQ
jgi:hypothetical protein